jgi:glycosyltransferase involved in cell wall biosynthesis
MRIAMVSEHASPLATLGDAEAGGQNVYVASLASHLARLGHRITVYTRRDDEESPLRVPLGPGVDVVHVPAGPARPVPRDEMHVWMTDFGAWLARYWNADPATRPDVVHAHFWMSGTAAMTAAGRLDTGPRPPVVQTFHALGAVKRRFQGPADTSPAHRIATERELLRTVDLVLATCSDEVRELRRLQPDGAPLQVVPCGVDLTLFSPDGPVTGPDAPPGQRVLYAGRLVRRKGVDTILEALTGLPQARLVIAGGPDRHELSNDPDVGRLRALAARLGVADRVDFIGQVPHDRLPELLRWADVVVVPPWYEPFGIVPLEVMACGRPLVGTAVGGLLDTVVPGESGVLVPPRDPEALRRAVAGLLADPVGRRELGVKARHRAETAYGWGRVAADVAAAYTTVARPEHTDLREAVEVR